MIDFNIDNYLRISPTDVILVLISTFLIVLFAKKFFWNKLLDFIQKRQDLIQQNIDQSAQLKQQALEEKEQYSEQLKNAGKEAHAILSDARAQAGAEKEQILKEANVQADRIKEAAREEIDRDRRKAESELKSAISEAALEAASALVKQEMNDETRKSFVDAFIDQAGESDQWQQS